MRMKFDTVLALSVGIAFLLMSAVIAGCSVPAKPDKPAPMEKKQCGCGEKSCKCGSTCKCKAEGRVCTDGCTCSPGADPVDLPKEK